MYGHADIQRWVERVSNLSFTQRDDDTDTLDDGTGDVERIELRQLTYDPANPWLAEKGDLSVMGTTKAKAVENLATRMRQVGDNDGD